MVEMHQPGVLKITILMVSMDPGRDSGSGQRKKRLESLVLN